MNDDDDVKIIRNGRYVISKHSPFNFTVEYVEASKHFAFKSINGDPLFNAFNKWFMNLLVQNELLSCCQKDWKIVDTGVFTFKNNYLIGLGMLRQLGFQIVNQNIPSVEYTDNLVAKFLINKQLNF